MLRIFLSLAVLLSALAANSQCSSVPLDNAAWTTHFADSEEPGAPASNAWDNDTTTIWHTEWSLVQPDFPHEVQINLGGTYAISGLGYEPRSAGSLNGKILDFEIYLSSDGSTWGSPEAAGTFFYVDNNDLTEKKIDFWAVDASYIRLVGLSNYTASQYYAVAAELNVYRDTVCGATGQLNQVLSFDEIPKHYASDAPFDLNATASSGLAVSYSIVSGPATVSGSTVSLTGTEGTVVVEAEQVGDAVYYPVATTKSFEVVDLSLIYPVITTKITEAHPLEMAALNFYPLYASSTIDEPEALSITQIDFEVDGNLLTSENKETHFMSWWKPAAYATYVVKVIATASNGNTTTESFNIEVTDSYDGQNITTFDGDVINFDGSGASRWFYGTYQLPQSLGAYDKIFANFFVNCPPVSGGCDDWDRLAYIEVKAPDGTWTEFIRYITPYGVGCDHFIEVTDFASLLQGNTEIRMFIDTWGSGGWDLTLDLNYIKGTPDYLYSHVQPVWQGTWDFGNPGNLQPLDTVSIEFPENATAAHFRVVSSGHGWGSTNTGNAAEFYHAIHHFHVDGAETYTQDLWNDCDPNPDGCTGQLGTWYFDRAGWCPGAIAPPHIYDFSSHIGADPFNLSYIFQETYQDICHPNNPACVSGVTCTNCNEGFNPHYRIGSYVISKGNAALGYEGATGISDIPVAVEIEVYPNPSDGKFRIDIPFQIENSVVTVHDVSGKTLRTWFFNTAEEVNKTQFDVSGLAAGTYFLKLRNQEEIGVKVLILQ